MPRYNRLLYLFVMLSLTACSEKTVTFEDFFDRIDQTETTRNVSAELNTEQHVNLSNHDIYRAGMLTGNSTHLFFLDWGGPAVVKISKSDPADVEVWNLSEGEGPGEVLSIRGLSADDERVFVGDPRNFRIVEMNTDGNHIRDLNVSFSPGNFALVGNGSLINNSPVQQSNLFVVYEPDADSLRGFEQGEITIEEAMKYTGYITMDPEHIFYGGYSEPLLRKYTAAGELMFSRSTIDNFNTENNYENRSTGDIVAYGFSEEAKYSVTNLVISQWGLFVIPHHNGNSDFRYLDIYDPENGDYYESLLLDFSPEGVVVDQNRIYTLARDEEDYTVRWYPKPD